MNFFKQVFHKCGIKSKLRSHTDAVLKHLTPTAWLEDCHILALFYFGNPARCILPLGQKSEQLIVYIIDAATNGTKVGQVVGCFASAYNKVCNQLCEILVRQLLPGIGECHVGRWVHLDHQTVEVQVESSL